MSLNIAMVAYTHYRSDPRVRREAEALASRGDRVTVWSLSERGDGSAERYELNGVRIQTIALSRYRGGSFRAYVGSYVWFLGAVGARLAVEHARRRLDLVHIHTMPDFMIFAATLPRLSGARVILDMHDLMPDLYALKFDLPRDGWMVRALKANQRICTSIADAVLCVHQNQYEILLRDGVPARKLSIVMNAADPALFPPRAGEPDASNELRVVYHGTILHRYGVDLGLLAFAKARTRVPRLRMQIVGGGDFVEDLRRMAFDLKLSGDSLDFTGEHRPLEEVASAIRLAHIGLVPNRDDHEDSVLPTKLLEYVAVGIPSVVTKTRCVERFFDPSQMEMVEVGNVEAMADAIVRLASDPERRRRLVENARRFQEEYGWEVNKRFLFRTVDALVSGKRLAKAVSSEASAN